MASSVINTATDEPPAVTETATPTNEGPTPVYTDYDAGWASSMLGLEKFAIFFHSEWCLPCVAWDDMMQEEISKLPPGTTIFRASYDDDLGLRQQYGITLNTSLVLVDDTGTSRVTVNPPVENVIEFFQ